MDTPGGRTSLEHYARVERERLPDENFLQALDRVAVEDAIAACDGNLSRAAKMLHLEKNALIQRKYRLKLKAVDREIAKPEVRNSLKFAAPEVKVTRYPRGVAAGSFEP